MSFTTKLGKESTLKRFVIINSTEVTFRSAFKAAEWQDLQNSCVSLLSGCVCNLTFYVRTLNKALKSKASQNQVL